jgi:hypothetical protein
MSLAVIPMVIMAMASNLQSETSLSTSSFQASEDSFEIARRHNAQTLLCGLPTEILLRILRLVCGPIPDVAIVRR